VSQHRVGVYAVDRAFPEHIVNRKCLTDSMTMPWQFGKEGVSDLQMQKRCRFRLMCPERS
jgi:hypothetical protein